MNESINTTFSLTDTHLRRLAPDLTVHDHDKLGEFLLDVLAQIGKSRIGKTHIFIGAISVCHDVHLIYATFSCFIDIHTQ